MFSELQVQVQIRRVPCKTFYGEWPSMGSEYNRCPVLLQDSTSGSSSPEEDDEESLISEPDMGSDPLESRRTWLVEQCLAWGGEQRLRLRLTLAFFPGHSPQALRFTPLHTAAIVTVHETFHCAICQVSITVIIQVLCFRGSTIDSGQIWDPQPVGSWRKHLS